MLAGTDKKAQRRFVEESIRHRPDEVALEEIVYLDEDLHTYKYFMTGKFDEELRKKEIMAQQAQAQRLERDTDSSAERSNSREDSKEP